MDNDMSAARHQPRMAKDVERVPYRVRVFEGSTRKEVSRRSAPSTKEAIRDCISVARERPGDYAVAQSTRQDATGLSADAYVVRYLTPAEQLGAMRAAPLQ